MEYPIVFLRPRKNNDGSFEIEGKGVKLTSAIYDDEHLADNEFMGNQLVSVIKQLYEDLST